MATLEDEIRDLKEKNNELVQKVQYWKMAAASKEDEKLELMKEINELRLKLSRIRSGGAAEARKLDAALQSASKEAISHLVKASNAVTRTIVLAKTYMQDRQEIDNLSPRWNNIGSTPSNEKIHRVPPMLMGGQSIQPVVSLSRTILNTNLMSRSPNRSRNVTERAVPLHMLQDLYIPLTRIDAGVPANNMDTENDVNEAEDSIQELGLDDSMERSLEGAQGNISGEDFEASRRLETVTEDLEPEETVLTSPSRGKVDNPLEGPSWLLDRPFTKSKSRMSKSRMNLEPDSTTEPDEGARAASAAAAAARQRVDEEPAVAAEACFTPTVRRRKRSATPPPAASQPARRYSNSGRVLKVMVAKMRLDDDSDEEASPAKRPPRDFDAPSPNGATDAALIVLEHTVNTERGSSGRQVARRTRPATDRLEAHNLDKLPGRNRRTDKTVEHENSIDEQPSTDPGHSRPRSTDPGNSGPGSTDPAHDRPSSVDPGYSRVGSVDLSQSRAGSIALGQSRAGSGGLDSDSGSELHTEGRTRRPRKAVTYKEKPLNRKMRR